MSTPDKRLSDTGKTETLSKGSIMETTTTTTTPVKVATLTIGSGRNGSGKLWLDGRHIFGPANMPAGTPYNVTYAPGQVTLTASIDGKKKVHHHTASGKPIVDLTNKKIASMLGIDSTVEVFAEYGRIIVKTTTQDQGWF
tara:strand:- start:867 stop:1286 length:420 start_codon:yes stop_codon:yes gene_type:complete